MHRCTVLAAMASTMTLLFAGGITACSSTSKSASTITAPGTTPAASGTIDTSPATVATTPATTPTTATAAADGAVTLVARFLGQNSNEDTITVSLTGAIEDKGTATQSATNGSDGESGTMALTLAKGAITASFEEHNYQINFDQAACSANPTSTAIITITSGTGAYAGLSGTLQATTAGHQVGATDAAGKCIALEKPPVSSDITLTATGAVHVGS